MPTYSNNALEGRRISLNAQQKVNDSVAQMNMQNAGNKKEEFKKLVYGLATNKLMNRKNTKAELNSGGMVGSFDGNTSKEWGASVGTHHIFFNPAVAEPKEVASTVEYAKPEIKEPPKPEEPLPMEFKDGLRPIAAAQMGTSEKRIKLDLSDFENFDLGSAKGQGYDDWYKSLPKDRQDNVNNILKQINDPNIRKALGKLQFNTGTDKTKMSANSIKKYTDIWNMTDDAGNKHPLRKWAEEQGLSNLDDNSMQYMLGKERYDAIKDRLTEGLKRNNPNFDDTDLFEEHVIQRHVLGKKVDNRAERYSKVRSVNGEEVIIPGTTKTLDTPLPKQPMLPWQRNFGR